MVEPISYARGQDREYSAVFSATRWVRLWGHRGKPCGSEAGRSKWKNPPKRVFHEKEAVPRWQANGVVRSHERCVEIKREAHTCTQRP